MNKLIIFVAFCFISAPSYGYLGPGVGGGFLVAFFSFFVAILIGIFGILYYPSKRFFKNKRNKNDST